MSCHRVLVWCETDPEYFRVAKKTVLRQFAKAAFDAGSDIELRWKAPQAVAKVASLIPEIAVADTLWSPPDGLSLFQCMGRGLLSFLESP